MSIRRREFITLLGGTAAAWPLAAKAATTTIPIVFSVAEDPVKLGLVTNFARPGSNATGSNFLLAELAAKRLGLLHELVPKAVRIAVLVNPGNATNTEFHAAGYRGSRPRAGAANSGLQCQHDPRGRSGLRSPGARRGRRSLRQPRFVFHQPANQFATLSARKGISTAHSLRDFVEAGGLMSYGTDVLDTYRQVGDYTGRIPKAPSQPTFLSCSRPSSSSLST